VISRSAHMAAHLAFAMHLAFAVSLALAALAGPALAQTATPTTAPSPPATVALIDINSATKDELATLSGIGPARAEAIIKGRPYRGKDELVQKKILPQSVYDAVKDRIVARQKS
jgi:competence protein ComEA